jgi:hypothetical protein
MLSLQLGCDATDNTWTLLGILRKLSGDIAQKLVAVARLGQRCSLPPATSSSWRSGDGRGSTERRCPFLAAKRKTYARLELFSFGPKADVSQALTFHENCLRSA